MSLDLPRRFATARGQRNGWDEPCKSRGLRTVLWAAGGEIPPADPADAQPRPNSAIPVNGEVCTGKAFDQFAHKRIRMNDLDREFVTQMVNVNILQVECHDCIGTRSDGRRARSSSSSLSQGGWRLRARSSRNAPAARFSLRSVQKCSPALA